MLKFMEAAYRSPPLVKIKKLRSKYCAAFIDKFKILNNLANFR